MAASGSPNVAVPIETAFAPARTNSKASRPEVTPPIPTIGISGSAARTW